MFYIFLSILLAFFFQIQILPIFDIKLDLLLFTALYYGFVYGSSVGGGVGILAGLLQDIFSGGILGMGPVGMVVCGLLAGYTRRVLLLKYWIVRVMLVFVFTVLNLFIYLLISDVFSQIDLFPVFKANWFRLGFGNMIFAGLIFWFIDRNE